MEKKEIKKELKELLSKDRYKHTVGVRYTAMCLGMKYEVDLDLCEMAGLLQRSRSTSYFIPRRL